MSKIVLDLNPSRCVCCYACVVACLDQHYNIDESGPPLRRAVRIESKEGKISCVSVGCMHCEMCIRDRPWPRSPSFCCWMSPRLG